MTANAISANAPDLQVIANGRPPAGRMAVSVDEKGRLQLPDVPAPADAAGLCAWLTAVLNRDKAHPIVAGEWMATGPRGPDGHVVLRRAAAPDIHIQPVRHINTPMRLIEILSWERIASDGAPYAYKGDHSRVIAHVVGTLCDSSGALSVEGEAEAIVGAFLDEAIAVEGLTTYGTTAQRYEAACALRRDLDESTGRPLGPPRYLLDAGTGELVVRVSDLAATARRFVGGTLARGWLDGRMGAAGWVRRQLDGHALSGRAGRQGPHSRVNVYRGHLAHGADAEGVTT